MRLSKTYNRRLNSIYVWILVFSIHSVAIPALAEDSVGALSTSTSTSEQTVVSGAGTPQISKGDTVTQTITGVNTSGQPTPSSVSAEEPKPSVTKSTANKGISDNLVLGTVSTKDDTKTPESESPSTPNQDALVTATSTSSTSSSSTKPESDTIIVHALKQELERETSEAPKKENAGNLLQQNSFQATVEAVTSAESTNVPKDGKESTAEGSKKTIHSVTFRGKLSIIGS